MRRDPQIRDYNESPPLVPGSRARFRWPEKGDRDVERIRSDVQSGAPGLFVLGMPDGQRKAIVEAYYPEGIRSAFYESELDPMRREDHQNGRLVAVNVLRVFEGDLDQRLIAEIRRNNREARSDLARTSSAHSRRLAIEDEHEAEFAREADEYGDAYAHAAMETRNLRKIRNTSTRRLD